MIRYVCAICGYIYTESAGAPRFGIPPGTPWSDVPDNWYCPLCGASKEVFSQHKG